MFQERLTYKACKDLERRVRSGTGTEDLLAIHECPGHSDPSGSHSHDHHPNGKFHYHFEKRSDDSIGTMLDRATADHYLQEILVEVVERAADIHAKVLHRGEKDGIDLPVEEANRLREDILQEALIRTIHKKVVEELRAGHNYDSSDGGLLANPAGYKNGPLDWLASDTIRDLVVKGYGVQHRFFGEQNRASVWKEIEMLEYDGKLLDLIQSSASPTRSDHICWLTPKDLDREHQATISKLLQILIAIPFELNKKANLLLQATGICQVSHFAKTGAFHKQHKDGGFGRHDNGRKVTVLYLPNDPSWQESDGGYITISRHEPLREDSPLVESTVELERLPPNGDCLILLRTRDMALEVECTNRKMFLISFWISGPALDGEKPAAG
eukprot:Platyproteum_vivax@DN14488_c0_g1_i1.p1